MKHQNFPLTNQVSKTLIVFSGLSLVAMNFAQATETEKTPLVELDPIVITATRTPTKTSNLIAQTTVINESDLQRYQGQTVLEVIAGQSAIHITQSGGMGTASNFYLRGYNNKNILVLIDGIRYGSISLGQPSLNLLSTEQVERIEILHGASGSSIYGADAVGGVIQVFTKSGKGINATNGFSVTAGAGSHNHYELGAMGRLAHEKTSATVSVNHTKTDGFNAVVKGTNFHSDDDGFENDSASISIDHQLTKHVQAGLSGFYNESITEYDGYPKWGETKVHPDAYADNKNGSANAFVEYQDDIANTRFSYGESFDDSTSYDNSHDFGSASEFNTTQKQARIESRINLASSNNSTIDNNSKTEHARTLLVGVERLKQELEADKKYDKDSRDITSGFLGYQISDQINSMPYDLQSNIRLDNNSQYGTKSTYNLGLAIEPIENYRLGASYATGFRSPTFNELYYPNFGNPSLETETSKNTEVFAEFDNDKLRARLTGYHNKLEDKIISLKNIDKAKIQGVSLTTDWRQGDWLMGVGYDYLDTENQGTANKGKLLPYSPKHQSALYLGYQADKFDVRVEGKHVGERYSDPANATLLDSYTLVNLNGNYYINNSFTAGLRINNVNDEEYTTSNQFGTEYATDGTNYFATLKYEY